MPHKASRLGIHTSRGFVQKNDWRVADQGHCDLKFSLVATAESSSHLVAVIFQIQVLDRFLDYSHDFSCADAFDERVEFDSLLNTQHGEDRIVLGTIPD